MYYIAKVALFLARLIVPHKLVMADNVFTHMTGNAAYTDPDPTLASLKTTRDATEAKYLEVVSAETDLAVKRAQLADLVKELDTKLTDLGSYCERKCGGSVAVLESSGFPLQVAPGPVGELPAPTQLVAKPGPNPGTGSVRCKPVYGAATYVAECATNPAGPWTQFYSGTRSQCLATGLTSGVIYYFRMAALGAAGQSPWSDISEKRAP